MEVQEELCFMNIIMSQEKKTYDEVKDFKIDIRTYEKLIIVDNIYKLDDIENIISSNKADIVFIDFCQNIQTK
jgi:2,4-dienoyl-CoA reductase-like NADH-dependent reductase (Old Yellow Enzyme family)